MLWICVTLNKKYEAFCDCECILYRNSEYIGKKNVAIGFRFRDRLTRGLKSIFKAPVVRNCSQLCLKSKPIISLHLWHLDVAIEIIQVFKNTSQFLELRLAVPDNLDQTILVEFLNHLKTEYQFIKVSTLVVPSIGRDTGGFISSLLQSLQSAEYKNRPHLFLHTKNTSQLHELIVRRWRETLIHDIADEMNLCISLFLYKYLNASIVYSKFNDRLECGQDNVDERKASYLLAQALSKELFDTCHDKIRFCAGTMMWVMPTRVEKVWSIEKLKAVLSKLEPSQTMQEPSYGHAFERLFPDSVRRSGLKVFTI